MRVFIVIAVTYCAPGFAAAQGNAGTEGGPLPVPTPAESRAATPHEMQAYTQLLGEDAPSFTMVPIPAGEFWMGSDTADPQAQPDEQPRHRVQIDAFWMGQCEVTWNEFDAWVLDQSISRWGTPRDREERKQGRLLPSDAVTRPSGPYLDMTLGMGHDGFPVICVSQLSAKMYCQWLTLKTGQYYRLPTEAEWEYACRAGSQNEYSFGSDADKLDEFAWSARNSGGVTHRVGKLKANPWGLYDMHGNVAEWVLDRYDETFYRQSSSRGEASDLLCISSDDEYPRVVRGGSYDDSAERLRSAARRASTPLWNLQDPDRPPSPWWLIDAPFVGFRIVRPFQSPGPEEIVKNRLGPDLPKAPMSERCR